MLFYFAIFWLWYTACFRGKLSHASGAFADLCAQRTDNDIYPVATFIYRSIFITAGAWFNMTRTAG